MILRNIDAQTVVILAVLSKLITGALAQVGGISGCRGQLPAVDSSLLDPSKEIVPGFFRDVEAVMTLGGVTLDPEATTLTEFPTGTNLRVEISSPLFDMTGVLIRVATTFEEDATGALTAGAGMETATACEAPVAGIVSGSARAKSTVNGVLRFDEPTLALLEATVVYRNDDTTSVFVYDNYALAFIDGAPTPTPPTPPTAPAAPVARSPVASPPSPVARSPVAAPSPVARSPIARSPVARSPVATPVAATTASPIVRSPQGMMGMSKGMMAEKGAGNKSENGGMKMMTEKSTKTMTESKKSSKGMMM